MEPTALVVVAIALGYVGYRLGASVLAVRADAAGDEQRAARLIQQARVVRRVVVAVLSVLLLALFVTLLRSW